MLTESDWTDPHLRRRHLIWLLDNAGEARFLGGVTDETRARARESLEALGIGGNPADIANDLTILLLADGELVDRTENNRTTLTEGLIVLLGAKGTI